MTEIVTCFPQVSVDGVPDSLKASTSNDDFQDKQAHLIVRSRVTLIPHILCPSLVLYPKV